VFLIDFALCHSGCFSRSSCFPNVDTERARDSAEDDPLDAGAFEGVDGREEEKTGKTGRNANRLQCLSDTTRFAVCAGRYEEGGDRSEMCEVATERKGREEREKKGRKRRGNARENFYRQSGRV
jgi:hypothetical protein